MSLNDVTDLEQLLKFTLENVLNVLRLKNGAIFLIDPKEKKAMLHAKSGLPTPASGDKKEIIFKDALLKKRLIEENTYLAPKPTFPSFQVCYRVRSGKPAPWLSCFQLRSKPGTGTRIRIEIPFSGGSKNE